MHFFPSSGNISAPYPAHCKLSLFGGGLEPKTVMLEGARISQPDGLFLDDVFPNLKEGGGFYGLFVELHTPQPRVDISASGCVVEFHSTIHMSRFWPVRLTKEGMAERRGALPLIQDPFQTSSVVIVNGSQESFRPTLTSSRLVRSQEIVRQPLSVPSIEPYSVAEVPIPATYFDEIQPQECGFGLMRMAGIEMPSELPPGCAVYVMYRDATSTHPVSVCAL